MIIQNGKDEQIRPNWFMTEKIKIVFFFIYCHIATFCQLLSYKYQLVLINKYCQKHYISSAWIDFKNECNTMPDFWIFESLKMFWTAEDLIQVLKDSMKLRKTKLYSKNEYLADVSIRRAIFQADSFSLSCICQWPSER